MNPSTGNKLSTPHAVFDKDTFPLTAGIEYTPDKPNVDQDVPSLALDLDTPIRGTEEPNRVPTSMEEVEELNNFFNNLNADVGNEDNNKYPYLTQEERDQGISTPPLPAVAFATVAKEEAFTDEASVDIGIPIPTTDDEPRTMLQAQRRPDWPRWQEAIEKELDSHQENHTWDVIDTPNNANIISCRWVFKVKRKGDGTIDKYKARLVAQGFTQVHGIDHEAVVKMSTLWLLMIMSLQYGMQIYQLDIITAYLNGELDVDLYMKQPPLPSPMSPVGRASQVCKLNKLLYGLKQAGCTWYQKADATLHDFGLLRSDHDSALYYVPQKDAPPVIVTLYVDDVLIFAKDKSSADSIIAMLKSKFKMTGSDLVLFILGIQIRSSPSTIHLSQMSNIMRLLAQFSLENANIVHTPTTAKDLADGVPLDADAHSLYRTILETEGSLWSDRGDQL